MSRATKAVLALAVATGVAVLVALALIASLIGAVVSGNAGDQAAQDLACGPADTGSTGDAVLASVARAPVKADAETAARAVLRAGWTVEQAPIAVAVAGGESTWDPTVRNSIGASGLFQMRLPMHADLFNGDWRDPYVNARAAHKLWSLAGWSPWVAYTSGSYQRYLPEARQAVAKVTADAPQVRFDPVTEDPSKATTKGLRPVAVTASEFIRQQWGFKGTIGGYATGGHMTNSLHYKGLAIDVMMPVGPLSNKIAAYFAGPGYKAFAVDHVIHNRSIYSGDSRGWHYYDGASPHTDHVHIDFHDTTAPTGAAPAVVPAVDTAQPVAECPTTDPAVTGGGSIVTPLDPALHARDNNNFGHTGGHWASTHTGNDYSTDCGDPVRAATDGTVQIDPFQAWAGPNLVKVSTGPGKLTTWYAHMQTATVRPGQHVTAGQQIGEVGRLGNATGCHLHFEVHPHGGTIYQDPVDPHTWLPAHVGRRTPARPMAPVAVTAGTPASGTGFTVASFNVLGDSHTGGHGNQPGRPNGPHRMPGAVRLLDTHAIDVVGFQEFQHSQQAAFDALAGDRYSTWHPGRDTENSIGWRRADWDRVDQTSLTIPYFGGRTRRMPAVALRFVHTGEVMWFTNYHNPADTGQFPHQRHWRKVATAREIRFFARLATTGRKMFVTGDMNEHRSPYVHAVTRSGLLHTAATRRYDGIDWILGTRNVRFLDHHVDDGPLVDRTTDHPLVYARVLVGD